MKTFIEYRPLTITMQHFNNISLIGTLVLLIFSAPTYGEIIAFHGVEGYGAMTIGRRGGQVIKVTCLDDKGPMSFREAVEASVSRTVGFEVFGIINLKSGLRSSNPFITISGQAVPGGILVTGFQTTVNTHEVIMRHMRFRVGSHGIAIEANAENLDAFDIHGKHWGPNEAYNIIIDHCSFSWGIDEIVTITGGVLNTTIQLSIVSEGLSHTGHPAREHSKGLFISGKYVHPNTISLHHNFIAHNTTRSPRIASPTCVDTRVEYINNVSYNWNGGNAPLQRGNAQANAIHNFSKQGPNSNSYSYEITSIGDVSPAGPKLYAYGNIGSTKLKQTDPQWHVGNGCLDELLSESFRLLTPWPTSNTLVAIIEESFEYSEDVMLNMGALKLFRDAVDVRVIGEYFSGTGQIIDNVVFPDDFPAFKTIPVPTDTDNDGMPDKWKTSNNLNPSVSDNDALMSSGYTAIEAYINELAVSPIILSTNDISENHNISISPNPISSIFTISLKDDVLIKASLNSELVKHIKEVTSN